MGRFVTTENIKNYNEASVDEYSASIQQVEQQKQVDNL